MKRTPALGAILFAATCFAGGLSACGDEPKPPPAPIDPAPASPPPPAPGAPPAGGAGRGLDGGVADGGPPPLPTREYQEIDFTETDKNRDPFRSYESLFVSQAKGKVILQRQVLVDRYALDELALVGVVTRGEPRALFTDPAKLGWVVKVGDFVGKAELVRSGGPGGADVAINWRVDRIRDSDVVFVREDPSHPEIPAATRVIALYPVEDANSQKGSSRR